MGPRKSLAKHALAVANRHQSAITIVSDRKTPAAAEPGSETGKKKIRSLRIDGEQLVMSSWTQFDVPDGLHMLADGRIRAVKTVTGQQPLATLTATDAPACAGTAEVASNARATLLAFAAALAVITYLDRVCISQAAPLMQISLGLDKADMGYAFAAFGWAYSLCEIPAGWMGDKFGARAVLLRVVLAWSVFTVATAWSWDVLSLVVCRALFGAGEAGCFPNVARAFSLWFPPAERVRAQGLMWLFARWGGALTPLLVGGLLAAGMHYKFVFCVFGSMGAVWAIAFARWFRDHPRDHPDVNAAELTLIHPGEAAAEAVAPHDMPWRKMLASRSAWMLCGQYFWFSYAWCFYITWFPSYLREQFPSLNDQQRAALGGIPLFGGGIGAASAGWLAKWLESRLGSVARVRPLGCWTPNG